MPTGHPAASRPCGRWRGRAARPAPGWGIVLRFAVRRLIGAIPTLLLIVTISFFLMRLAPGGPFDKERTVPAEIEARLQHAYHLDDPLPLQFLRYLGNLIRGDFGPSFQYKDFSVTELIWGGFPVSLRLGALAIIFALVI